MNEKILKICGIVAAGVCAAASFASSVIAAKKQDAKIESEVRKAVTEFTCDQ